MNKIGASFELTLKQFRWGIVLVLLLAATLRLYQLGQVPHGMYWDEAAIGYNGYAVLTTRRDEWLTRLPVSFRSFGDYKAPLAIYLNGPFTYLFGMTLFAVRLPFALAGIAAVLGMIYLTRIIFEQAGETPARSRWLATIAGGLITLSPWHYHFSRIGFESGLALMFFIWAIYFFFKALAVKQTWRKYVDFTLSVLGFVASVYSYHSAKFAAPLVMLILVIWHRKAIFERWKSFAFASVLGAVALRPVILDSLFGKGLERAGLLIFSQGYSLPELISAFFIHFGEHLSLPFLLFGKTITLRHSDGHWGVLLATTLSLIIISLLSSWLKKSSRSAVFRFSLALLVIGLLPAVLGIESPHGNRAFLALPGFLLLAVQGLRVIINGQLRREVVRSLIGLLILLHSLLFVSYLHDYYTRFAAASAGDFQDGYLEAFRFALPYERGEDGRAEVDKIIFTGDYGQPYIYALFVRKTNPIWYQSGSLIKYEFKDEITVGDLERENTLVVASMWDDLLGKNDQADQIIYGSDGTARFRIYLNQ